LPASIYFDANVLIAYIDEQHAKNVAAIDLVGEALTTAVSYTSLLTLDEVWYVLAWTWANRDGRADLGRGEAMHFYADRLRGKTGDLFAAGVSLLPVPPDAGADIYATVAALVGLNRLKSRDLFHAGYALHRQAAALATTDSAFQRMVLPDARDFTVVTL
jgi:predicted nucleic acid-binding protein